MFNIVLVDPISKISLKCGWKYQMNVHWINFSPLQWMNLENWWSSDKRDGHWRQVFSTVYFSCSRNSVHSSSAGQHFRTWQFLLLSPWLPRAQKRFKSTTGQGSSMRNVILHQRTVDADRSEISTVLEQTPENVHNYDLNLQHLQMYIIKVQMPMSNHSSSSAVVCLLAWWFVCGFAREHSVKLFSRGTGSRLSERRVAESVSSYLIS